MAADGGQAVLQHLGVVIVQNLNDIAECADQQHLIQMGCLATAMIPKICFTDFLYFSSPPTPEQPDFV